MEAESLFEVSVTNYLSEQHNTLEDFNLQALDLLLQTKILTDGKKCD
jgi:hypothetical protein